ncbi:Lon protease family protein [Natronospira bacteriovora]|uniref:endopeptidase La n=1 Tax=Natronospira bacteriovora TaxID=3069753 RepID=A0ABU0W7G8_9GAMM|nr:ATP-binding protein [Natronospira sp. AB-CW4]MDQ2069969.1 ATP-binding protein [Natronospira sp. AB-CW4]
MPAPKALAVEQLYQVCDPANLDFHSTDELDNPEGVIGQQRALDALSFGAGMRSRGYNIFVLGPNGVGKKTVVRKFLAEQAAAAATPPDWCHVHNFEDENRPRLLRFESGQGQACRRDMDKLLDRLKTVLPASFESEDYQNRLQAIKQDFQKRQQEAVKEIEDEAEEYDIALIQTASEMSFAPRSKGEVMEPEQFHSLPKAERERFESRIEALQEQLQTVAGQFPKWRTEMQERVRELNEATIREASEAFLEDVERSYPDHAELHDHIRAIGSDLVVNHGIIARLAEEDEPEVRAAFEHLFTRYGLLVLVDNSDQDGAPVVYHDFPTHQHLIGRVEHKVRHGALVTDYSLIRPGALHRANGGYLILEAEKVLSHPFAWDSLKRALYARQVRIESLEQMYSSVSTVSLEPQPMPLDIKVLLLGDRHTYYLLAEHDPEFGELFKVQADFEDDLPRGRDNDMGHARLVASIVQRESLLALGPEAVARVIEHGSRLAEDRERMSAHAGSIADLLREADHWARMDAAERIRVEDIQKAIDQQEYRARRVEERMDREIARQTVLLDTSGKVPGQINGLTVMQLGSHHFGRPVRITAATRLGSGSVVDIEREVELGGPLHSKGVLILSGFLGAHYAPEHNLSVNASLVFEQGYSEIDGDSASLAELCALLSDLAGVGIRQALAVTGSVNQKGQIQAIGGVNEKIEGFFKVCQQRGLDGSHGVIIPRSNLGDLMLDHQVRDAVSRGLFNVYAVADVDEAMSLLTGRNAGRRRRDGSYPAKSLNAMIEEKLVRFARIKQEEEGGDDE